MARSASAMITLVLVCMMLVFGSYNTINMKFQDQTCASTIDTGAKLKDDGCPVGKKLWAKPWLQNLVMFMGEASVGVVYLFTRRTSPPVATQNGADGLLEPSVKKTPFLVFAVPAFCDVFGTGLASVAMLFLDSAVWQMLRSSIIIFSAITSVLFLKKKLQPFHWFAVLVVFVGLLLVGLSSSLDAGGDSDEGGAQGVTVAETLMGIFLVIFAQVCAAFQMVFEEKLLTGGEATSAKKVVGCEGVWGIIFMVIMLTTMSHVPGSDNGHYEDFSDGVHMLATNPALFLLVFSYMVSIAVYNLTGIVVGKYLSAVVRCLVDSCRTIVVWTVNLAMYYFISTSYGTAWKPHSWLMALGFLLLVVGTLLYNEVLPVPKFLTRPSADAEEQECAASFVSGSFHDILHKVDHTDESEGCQSRQFARGTSSNA